MSVRVPILMYHGIAPAPGVESTPQWSPHHTISYEAWSAQLALISSGGWRTLVCDDFEEARQDRRTKQLAVTFDDGHRSDIMAAEMLRRHGLKATFFITWNHLGTAGYLRPVDVKAIAAYGFRVGAHGLNHTRMSELDEPMLRRELGDSKKRLEDLIGAPVRDLACPFGAYNRRVIATARELGYRSVMTSDIGQAAIGQAFRLPRLPIRNDMSLDDFRTMISEDWVMTAWRRLLHALARRKRGVEVRFASAWRTWIAAVRPSA